MAFAFIFMVCVFAVIVVSVSKGKSAQVRVEKLEFPDDEAQARQEDVSPQEYEPVPVSGPVEAYDRPTPTATAPQEAPVRPTADTAARPAAKAPAKPAAKAPAAATARTATPAAAGRASGQAAASTGEQHPTVDLGSDEEKRKLIIYSEILKPKFDR